VETYILMAICLVVFLGSIALFRFLVEDREMGLLYGCLAGLVLALAAGFGYFEYLAACRTCV